MYTASYAVASSDAAFFLLFFFERARHAHYIDKKIRNPFAWCNEFASALEPKVENQFSIFQILRYWKEKLPAAFSGTPAPLQYTAYLHTLQHDRSGNKLQR